MGKVRYARPAGRKIESIASYYDTIDPGLRSRVLVTIVTSLNSLLVHPKIGRPFRDDPLYRERVIEFGSTHFLALYRTDPEGNIIVVAVKHEKEESYDLSGLTDAP